MASNIADFANEMDPELLIEAGEKLLSATGKFTAQLTGNPDVVSKLNRFFFPVIVFRTMSV